MRGVPEGNSWGNEERGCGGFFREVSEGCQRSITSESHGTTARLVRGLYPGNVQENKREEGARLAVQKAKYWFTIFMAQ